MLSDEDASANLLISVHSFELFQHRYEAIANNCCSHSFTYRTVTRRFTYRIVTVERFGRMLSILHEFIRPPGLTITKITFRT